MCALFIVHSIQRCMFGWLHKLCGCPFVLFCKFCTMISLLCSSIWNCYANSRMFIDVHIRSYFCIILNCLQVRHSFDVCVLFPCVADPRQKEIKIACLIVMRDMNRENQPMDNKGRDPNRHGARIIYAASNHVDTWCIYI